MPHSRFSGSLRSPKIDVVIDMGNPFLNRTVDGFLKIGAVGACKVAAEETFECLHRGSLLSLLPSPFSLFIHCPSSSSVLLYSPYFVYFTFTFHFLQRKRIMFE